MATTPNDPMNTPDAPAADSAPLASVDQVAEQQDAGAESSAADLNEATEDSTEGAATDGAAAEAEVADTDAADTDAADTDATSTDATDADATNTDDAASDEPQGDPRIPAVITTRTLFFLAPDLPEPVARPRQQYSDESDDDHEPRGRGRSRRGRRGGTASREPQQHQQRQQREEEPEEEPELITEPQKVHGSTRLAAKRQRRRDGRDTGRRRTVVTESEFQARREAVDRKMLVRSRNGKVQIGVLEDNVLVEHYVARSEESSLIGNVYLGRVQNVLPSMEAAFVDIGRARNAVLYSGEVDWAAAEMGANQPRKIENALKPGDKVLVQVTKDPIGHKGARLTSQVSLPGRYLVYVPGNTMNGISRKLPDTERNRLKKILKEVLPPGVGVIVRTAAEGATKEQLQLDVERLTKQWADIQAKSQGGKAPQTLHAEPDMLIKIIRDVFNEDFDKLIIQGQSELDTIKHYLGQVAPDLLERVERYDGGGDIFADFRANDMIDKALARKVWLPSGGSLVIDRTEAMTVVDVNTGKFVGSGGNLEETVTKNNLEAAEEVVRQLRLRDIGGIIVIDFIDMVLESNRDLVLRRLVECLSRDRTKHQVAEVTSLGLVQMTRKKIGLGLLETFSEGCDTCDGRGVVIQSEPVNHGTSSNRNNRSKRGRGGQEQQSNQRQQPRQQQSNQPQASKPANGGTHEITEDARNALTKIAASINSAAKPDAEPLALEAVTERLAIVAEAVSGPELAEELTQVANAEPKPADSDAGAESASTPAPSDQSNEGNEESGSRRSRRGRRGRGRGNRNEQDQRQDASRDDAQQSGAKPDTAPAAPAGEQPQEKSAVRTREERASVSIELPEPVTERRQETKSAASLGALDAALDSLVAAPPQERAERRTRGGRRRVTTGPISTGNENGSE